MMDASHFISKCLIRSDMVLPRWRCPCPAAAARLAPYCPRLWRALLLLVEVLIMTTLPVSLIVIALPNTSGSLRILTGVFLLIAASWVSVQLRTRAQRAARARECGADPTQRLAQIDTDFPALPPKAHGDDPEGDYTCAICLDDIEAGDVCRQLACRHEFHVACLDKWWLGPGGMPKLSCPLCRRTAEPVKVSDGERPPTKIQNYILDTE
mmetsp:Transcript_52491/g.170487  ORF Transcript_52491/g.170487 Transcript_52491/m.170487 type:complete len:210 (-) Transcript_52491:207-836(-)